MTIRMLDENTVMKIAAGEVIENPASVIKELVENAIDAKSDAITVEIKNGGKTHMRITDNGEGIASDEVDLAFERHATSKIHNYDDLFSVDTMGFRGEALASIRAVSEVSVFTKQQEDVQGHFVKFIPGKETQRQTIAHNQGTTLIVENLFANVPVRAGFLKSALAESNRITDLMYRFAVSHPTISFRYVKDEKMIFKTSGTGIKNTFTELFQSDFTEKLIPIEYHHEDVEVRGYIGNTSLYRGNRNLQYIFVNRRLITEPTLTQLIEGEYASRIPHGRFPIYFLWIYLDPSAIDVNIHPTKQNVQWRCNTELFTPLKYVIREALLSDEDRNQVILQPQKKEHTNLMTLEKYESLRKEQEESIEKREKKEIIAETPSIFSYMRAQKNIKSQTPEFSPTKVPPAKKEVTRPDQKYHDFSSWQYLTTLYSTYLLFMDLETAEVILVDQHAAHERIHYEQFLEEYKEKNLQTQMLLLPQKIHLRPDELTQLEKNIDFFHTMGFTIEPIGEMDYLLRGIPYLFGEIKNPQGLFISLLDSIESIKNTSKEDLEMKIIKKACVASVKAGEVLTTHSIHELTKRLERTKEPFTCPHGRPTFIRMNRKQFDKLFQRIQS